MTFTAMSVGTWLTLFGSIGGAITLLYLLRLRRRRVEVPFGPLWQQVLSEKQTTSLFKVLKRFLSLFVQLAILALVLTAIADPRWTGELSVDYREPREPEPSHTLLVLDTSASMSARDVEGGRLIQAQRAAHRVIDAMQPGESIMLARMDHDVYAMTDWSTDRDLLRGRLNTLEALDTGTDPEPLMQFARNAVRGLPNAQVVLITDTAFEPPDEELARAIKLRVVPVGTSDDLDNVAVLDFNVRSHLGNTLRYALYYKLKNLSERPVRVAAYLYTDPRGEAQSRADFLKLPPTGAPSVHELGPGEEKVIERLDVSLEGSRAALMIEPEGESFRDVLPADDAAFAVVPEREDVRVLLVGEDNLFLRAALQTRSHVAVEQVPVEAYPGAEGYDLVVFNHVAPAEPGSGNFIYVNVTEKTPYPVRGERDGGELLVPSSKRNHPVMRHVKFVDLEAERLVGFQRARGQEVLAHTRRGAPGVLAKSDESMRWVAVGFDPIVSRWVTHYSFSIFFVNAINWFFHEESEMLRAWSLAERWDVRVPWGVEEVRVTRPDGTVETALVDGAGLLAYAGSREGIYEVRHPDPGSRAEPVPIAAALRNVDESRLTPRGEYTQWEPPAVESDEMGAPEVLGADLWQILVMLAGLLMLVEWFTYHRRWTV